MIKLISADMDGTLLDSNKKLSPELFPMIEALTEQGIRFAAASGRQYYNLEHIFEPVKDKMIFIAENGSVVFERDTNSFASVIDRKTVWEIVRKIRKIEGVSPVICGLKGAYAESDEPELMENIKMYYHRYEIMDDILETGDDICKIAVYDYVNAETNCHAPLVEAFGEQMEIAVSGEHWVDISNPGCNKGTAISKIQEKYGIGYEETMLFGDYLNDYEMMKTGKYSYAMENAHPQLKEICNYTAKSNDENGVVEAIRAYFN
ncbi:HAD family hydrolase [Eubacterium sp. 1001713B170207_170306_E7]|uniref:HAD family hydrolase n=1 Tax=Eubacterium sp. 1001713B170207_170306_E7 TaxID=2787097 RepID=UPI00189BDF0F|nr:HAD family hydrolase [Eubacterium sp. 1001713B170207_170306_E7]